MIKSMGSPWRSLASFICESETSNGKRTDKKEETVVYSSGG